MTQKGIAATTRCDKHDGCLEYIVRIPVSSDGTAGKVENGAKEEEGEFEVKVVRERLSAALPRRDGCVGVRFLAAAR